MSRSFTFIHAADLHLDAPFAGIDARDPRVHATLVEATYVALDRIVETALERAVDFVVIAGDAYNSRDRSLRAQLRFKAACERLDAAGVHVFVAQGNHDPADGWTARLTMPANLHVFAHDAVERVEVPDPTGPGTLCTLLGRSYATAATRANLARGFRRDSGDETVIGVLHANVGGQEGYEPYAPCTLEDLRAAGVDYWALGHIHKHADLLDEPRSRYSGSPQGLNPKEDGPHGCYLVTMERGRVIAEEFVPTAAVVWAREAMPAEELDTLDAVRAAVTDACERARAAASGTPVVLRLDVTGRTPVHADLARGESFAELVSEVREEQLAGSPWVWLDRVRNLTAPALDIGFLRGVEDFTGDLVRIADGLLDDADAGEMFVAEALASVESAFGSRERDVPGLIEQARDLCLGRMLAEEGR